MAIYRLKKIQIDAPPPGALLPRWSYVAQMQNTADPTDQPVISFISDDENPLSDLDACNTIKDLLGIDQELDWACA